MSWQLVSFLIVGALVLAGFAWYERSRPPAQIVALVAALAALSVAGRVAFAALPNVKPLTTDVIVFAGYALGGAPGFAVGALSALVSNFWFGQGPWTPWQMAAWGLCGVLGAVLALGTRNAGRLALAATCGLAALLYGALLNFSLMATFGGELSLRAYGVWWTRGIAFEAAHAGGNVAFALLAGPAMVRMLTRFRDRFAWRRAGSGLGRALRGDDLAALAVVLAAATLALAAPAPAHAAGADVARATAWLRSAQNEDGGFGASPGDPSSPEITCWAALALAAGGENPLDAVRRGRSPIDYLRAHLGQLRSSGDYARTILALESAGADPRDFGGENLVSRLLARRRADGSYEGWPGTTAFAAIALRAAGATGGLDQTLAWLRSVQNADGGWGDVPGSPSTPDGTGAAMQALSGDSKALHRGLEYLRGHQHGGGGYALGGGGPVNTPSTAWAVQGILAAGADPASFVKDGASALDYLAANQGPEGDYDYARAGAQTSAEVAHQTPVWVTAEAVPAAAGDTFPIAPPPRAPKPRAASAGGAKPGAPAAAASPDASPPGAPSGAAGGSSRRAAPGSDRSAPGPRSPPQSGAADAPASTAGASAADRSGGSGPADGGRSGGSGGALLVGLLAGCLLFGTAWLARRGWMRWRYGLR